MKLLIGEGLLMSEGDFWRRQRKLAQPAFHRQRLGAFAATMADQTSAMLERWDQIAAKGRSVDVAAEMMRLTMGIVSQTLFSVDVSSHANAVGAALTTALDYIQRRSLNPFRLPASWPTPNNRRFQQAVHTLDALVYRLIAERRQSGEDRGDLLSLLLLARDEETGAGMNDRQLRDEVQTIFLAGHETTANALAWTFYLLSRHPDVARRMLAEVDATLGGRPPGVADLPNLVYTRQVIDEALRLYPPAWATNRSPLADDVIGGYPIPANATLLISPYTLHRHRAFWENPEGFDPDRFTPARSAGRPRFAYLPFGGGPRICIGNNFALMEAVIILAMVSQRYQLHLVPGHPVVPQPLVVLRPRDGMLMTLQRRTGAV